MTLASCLRLRFPAAVGAEQNLLKNSRRNREVKMDCSRCEEKKEAEYRVFSDIIDMKVCAECAAEARQLKLKIQVFYVKSASSAEYMRKAS